LVLIIIPAGPSSHFPRKVVTRHKSHIISPSGRFLFGCPQHLFDFWRKFVCPVRALCMERLDNERPWPAQRDPGRPVAKIPLIACRGPS
jgi:hypothetical protein